MRKQAAGAGAAAVRRLSGEKDVGGGQVQRGRCRRGRLGASIVTGLLLVAGAVVTVAGQSVGATPSRSTTASRAHANTLHWSSGNKTRPSFATPENCSNGMPPQFSGFSGGTGAFHSDHFLSDFVQAPAYGANDIPNGDFTNIFLFQPTETITTWDQFIATLPPAERPPTQEQIDAMTLGLVCSSYFDLLTQYNLNTPVYAGDETTIAPCVDNALNDAMSTNNVISYATMRTFAGCESEDNNDPSPQVNIFVAPNIQASGYDQDGTDMCALGDSGYHGSGVNVPQWTAVETNPKCDSNPGGVMDTLSHEMVELISDNFGLGWIHNVWPDFNETYDQGELADICTHVGAHPTPVSNPGNIPFPNISMPNGTLTGLTVGPYWSDQDAQCEPGEIMNDTPIPLAGSPSVTFSGSLHSLTVHVSDPNTGSIQALELDVATGSSGLNGGNSLDVSLTVNLGGTPHTLPPETDLNEGTLWGNDTLHAVLLSYPPGISPSEITQISLSTDSTSWNVAGLELQASVVAPSGGCSTPTGIAPPVDVTGHTPLSDGSTGLMRLTGGSTETFPESLHVPAADKNLQVTNLSLVVGTGGDDLRGGNQPQDNANAFLTLASGQQIFFNNINDNSNWTNGFTSNQIDLTDSDPPPNVVPLNVLPPDTTAGELSSISLQTDLPGGSSGDNWDVKSITLFAAVGCTETMPPPTFASTTLVDDVGTTTLPDGTVGLCRLTGSNNDCPVSIPAVPPSEASDPVTALQVTITTGGDNLRGGGEPGDNANVILTFGTNTATFVNVNNSDDLENGTVFSFPLVPVPTTTLGQITAIDVHTAFGSLFPDNWDIAAVEVDAIFDPPGASPAGHGSVMHVGRIEVDPRAALAFGAAPAEATAPSRPSAPVLASGAQPAASPPAGPAITAKPPSDWFQSSSPNQGSGDNKLFATSCADPSDCVSVGDAAATGGVLPLAEVLTGGTWTITPTPSLGGAGGLLYGVSCADATDCMAVGVEVLPGSGAPAQTLAESWNGSTWTIDPTPPQGDNASLLNGVSCVTADDCVAVGHVDLMGDSQTLVEMWNGSAWAIVGSPDEGQGDSLLQSVSCADASDCTAVGLYDGSGVPQTLVESWSGGAWSVVASPDASSQANILSAVSCTAPSQCKAVGDWTSGYGAPTETLVENWNGTAWTVATSPSPGKHGNELDGVSCSDATDCVASGSSFNGSVHDTLIEVWNGTAWTTTVSPNPGASTSVLFGVSCTTPISCEAVGADDDATGTEQTLVLAHYVPTPALTELKFNFKTPNPTLTLLGSGFEPVPPSSAAGCADTGLDYAIDSFYVFDSTGTWYAGMTGDCVGLVVSKYSNTKIVFTFGSGYSPPDTMNHGDYVEVWLYDSTCQGNVPAKGGAISCFA